MGATKIESSYEVRVSLVGEDVLALLVLDIRVSLLTM
jgi:hypothetical protein